eukprot:1158594-Pelagomonas_calceolata.AAC.5
MRGAAAREAVTKDVKAGETRLGSRKPVRPTNEEDCMVKAKIVSEKAILGKKMYNCENCETFIVKMNCEGKNGCCANGIIQ